MEGVSILYYSTKGTISCHPWENWISKLSEGGKTWWAARHVCLVAVEAEKPTYSKRELFIIYNVLTI